MINLFDNIYDENDVDVGEHVGDGFDGTMLEVTDSVTGEVIGYVGGSFSSGSFLSLSRCYSRSSCVLPQPVGGTNPEEYSWVAQSPDGLTIYAFAEPGDGAA